MRSSDSARGARLQDARRWEAPVFGAAPVAAPPPPPPRTAEEIESIEAAAYEEGFARGRADGFAAGAADARAQALADGARLRELLEHCARPLAHLDAEVEAVLVEMALQAAGRLVQYAFELEPARIAGTVREALAAMASVPREILVHLHPGDAEQLKDYLAPPAEPTFWRIVPDASLKCGDCRLSGDTGWVDATLESRVCRLLQSLMAEGEVAA